MKNVVIMPIHTKYLDLIVSGSKNIEMRKRAVWSSIEWVLFYENGTNLITAKAKIMSQGSYPLDVIFESQFFNDTGITKSELLAYAGRHKELECLFLIYAERLDTPLTLADVGLTHAPQSYVYRDMEVPE